MLPYPLHIAFSSYTIIGLTLLILASSVAIYLLRLTSKSQSTWPLIGFFIMVALSGGATILTNTVIHWGQLFIPWQDFWILAGGVALAHFAYSLPLYKRTPEARVALILMGSLAVSALLYCLYFDFRILYRWTPELDVSDSFYLLLPIGTLLIIIIFLRRSVQSSTRFETAVSQSEVSNVGRRLIHPQGEDAKTLRSMALALSLAFLPGFQTLLGFSDPYGFILSNIGSILAIVAIALIYFNYAPEANSFITKLVGITLSTVLLIIAIFGSVDIYLSNGDFMTDRLRITAALHDALIRTGDISADPLRVAYVVSWDASQPGDAGSYRQLYHAEEEDDFGLDVLIKENQDRYLETWSQALSGSLSQLTNDNWRYVRRYWTYPLGSTYEDYLGYIFTAGNRTYEIGYSSIALADRQSVIVSRWLILILSSSAFVLLIFPLFFRRILVEPLENLLDGVTRVNQGNLDTSISLSFNDEIGFLTHSFNQMVRSTKDLTEKLEDRALLLEEKVSERTIELTKANVELEKENKIRENAEAQLNQQLVYQQSLASCSQALLLVAEDENDQKEVLTQALEHLRSGARASRAYIFHNFDDPDLGLCMGMVAEACAPGIDAHITNPVNQKFPWSRLPTTMLHALKSGEAHGGPVEEVFASTPDLREAFLRQPDPLLSIQCFPISYGNRWWGFVGFDDCKVVREWDTREVTLLSTASEMIGNTLQRWQVEEDLRETLSHLEERVRERTIEYAQANAELRHEIFERQRFQDELEGRLDIEKILANISSRLLEPTLIGENIKASLEDLGRIMDAGRIFLVEFDLQATNLVRNYFEWRKPEASPISEEVVPGFMESLSGLRDRLRQGETIYIKDTAQFPSTVDVDMGALRARAVQSLVLSPLTIDHRVHAVLGCSNLQAPPGIVQMNIRTMELVASMLKSLLQRQHLIQSLEEQVAERTRQLTTFLDVAMLNEQAHDLADILQPTLHSITQIVACDACVVHIINEKNANLEVIAQRGISNEFLQPLSEIPISAEFSTWLEEADAYEVLDGFNSSPVFPEQFNIPDYQTFFVNRLSTGNKSVGLLSCYRLEDQPFSPLQTTLLTALGEILGIIVENHRLRIEAGELAAVEERQRLAREIHDAVSQSVYSLSLFARSANDALDDGNQAKLLTNLQDIEVTALQAMREMRLLLYHLREAGQDGDIAAALVNRFKQVERRLGIQATSEIKADIIPSNHIQHEVWRIIIEALNNSVKHARAEHVQVQISCADDNLVVTVQDDGIGFDRSERFPGMGLKNMQKRAETLGGQVDIMSALGQGTQIRLKIPMACMNKEKGD